MVNVTEQARILKKHSVSPLSSTVHKGLKILYIAVIW
jgi:hypothetical protein